MSDDRPSIAELQRMCADDGANHDADLALAAPSLLAIVSSALSWQSAVRARCDFVSATYASNPFDVTSEQFRDRSAGMDETADLLLLDFLAHLHRVRP